jgi:hypothetical protein
VFSQLRHQGFSFFFQHGQLLLRLISLAQPRQGIEHLGASLVALLFSFRQGLVKDWLQLWLIDAAQLLQPCRLLEENLGDGFGSAHAFEGLFASQ